DPHALVDVEAHAIEARVDRRIEVLDRQCLGIDANGRAVVAGDPEVALAVDGAAVRLGVAPIIPKRHLHLVEQRSGGAIESSKRATVLRDALVVADPHAWVALTAMRLHRLPGDRSRTVTARRG